MQFSASLREKIKHFWVIVFRKYSPLLFFFYGVYSAFSIQRDFQHTTRLAFFLLGLVPLFHMLNLLGRLATREETSKIKSRAFHFFEWFSHWLTQNFTQYILSFCLPFFVTSRHWGYLAITSCLLATTLWEGWWKRLIKLTSYRQVLRLWSALCAGSFLFPTVWPSHLSLFYPALVGLAFIALLPTQLNKVHFLSSGALLSLTLIMTLLLPDFIRFPVLSIWIDRPHFAVNEDAKDKPHYDVAELWSIAEFKAQIEQGSSICCIAPVVGPPGLRERISQEWSVDGKLLERPVLKSLVLGNLGQKGYHSFFCKKNFSTLAQGSVIKCRLLLQNALYLGETSLHLR